MEDAILKCGGADLGVVSKQQAGELAQERSMTMRHLALQESLALDHRRRWKQALHQAPKHHKGELHVGQPLCFWRRGANAAKKPTNAFWHPGVVISNTLATVWIAYRGSVVKCARSQVRRFHDDDEAAHEHVTEHWENGYSLRATSRTKALLDKMNLPWTAHPHKEKTQRQDPQDTTAKDRWMWTPKREDE